MYHRHLHIKKSIEYALALLFIISVLYLGSRIGYKPMISFMEQNYVLGLILYFIYTIISNIIIFLPLVPLWPVVAFLYGSPTVMFITISGTLIGASICFFLAKYYGKNLVMRMIGRRLFNEVNHLSQFNSKKGFLAIRLLGNNYYDLVSYMAGLSTIGFKSYLFITSLATIIWTIILFFLIEKTGGLENFNSFLALIALYGFLVLLGTLIWELYHRRRHLRK